MLTNHIDGLITDVKISSVVPASFTGEGKVHEFTNMDLAMKLHYIKGVYFFTSDATQGLTIHQIKFPMFKWLDLFYHVCGRIRRHENGTRPYIKCNDSGVRIVEAKCSKTIDEWLALDDSSLNDQLVYDHVLGPDLGFTPLVYLQFTMFKCGGMSVGMSYAHMVGDAFSASDFINMWGQIMAGHNPPEFLDTPKTTNCNLKYPYKNTPFSLKKVDPVGDYWKINSRYSKIQTHTFHVTTKQLNHLLLNITGSSQQYKAKPFEVLSAIFWKSLAKIRSEESEPKVITLCTKGTGDINQTVVGDAIRTVVDQCMQRPEVVIGDLLPSNTQVISTVKAQSKVAEADVLELAKLIAEKSVDERSMIEELTEDEMKDDYIVYGANLTFLNLEGANIYGLEIKGHKPIFANYSLNGVGKEGAILMILGPGNDEQVLINVLLPQEEIVELKDKLREEWHIY